AVGHDGYFLYVEFIDGKVARYVGVSPDVVQQLRESPSVGRTFNELVRGQTSFSYVPMRGTPDKRESGATR
ncbi:MAG TPA: KTSC domain-containing protein, partial [Candidatus Binatus sp.]|nr:KTSC domain-containing protein [Candidatus Binatus sp.]